jgi:hypothetical protein
MLHKNNNIAYSYRIFHYYNEKRKHRNGYEW